MKKVIRGISLFICLSCILCINVKSIFAQDTGTIPFEVAVIPPSNQLDNIQSYFNLEMHQGQQQSLQVVLKNKQSKPITINMKALKNRKGLKSLRFFYIKTLIIIYPALTGCKTPTSKFERSKEVYVGD